MSTNGHCKCAARATPTVLLPLPGAPIKTMRVIAALLLEVQIGDVGLKIATSFSY